MMEWQPIESAPKDGTEFVMLDANVRVATVGHWREAEASARAPGSAVWRPFWFPLATPTHWMPLPELPKETP